MTRLPQRFLDRFVVSDAGCWEWRGQLHRGYGYFRHGGSNRRAHRVAYELLVGEVPVGLVLDHLCCNTRCVNPKHLEPVTQHENVLRALPAAARTHCPNGHEFTPENTRYNPASRGRLCRECGRQGARAYQARKRQEAAT